MIHKSAAGFDWTLPSKDYRDPALFERERREIFAKNWMLFCWSERLQTPGDYVTGAVAGYPVFAIRDDAGRIRASTMSAGIAARSFCRRRLATAVSSSFVPTIAGATRAMDA